MAENTRTSTGGRPQQSQQKQEASVPHWDSAAER